MSRFFADLNEEKKEIKKKFTVTQKQTEKLSKKEKLLNELETRVKELMVDQKNLKKFISDLKKYSSLEIPENVKDFLQSKLVYKNTNKILIDKFLSKNKEEEVVYVKDELVENNVIDEDKEYERIQNIKDTNTKIQKMNDFFNTTENKYIRVNILINLLSLYTKIKDKDLIYNTLIRSFEYSDDIKTKIFFESNINFYLDLYKSDLHKYKSILDKVKKVDEIVYKRRQLELAFENSEYCESDQLDFQVLFLAKNNKKNESFEIFKKIDLLRKQDYIFVNNIREYSEILMRNKKYYEAYECYKYIYNNTSDNLQAKKNLYILCVILNKAIKKDDFFKKFLLDFKNFSQNIFALKSKDDFFEIFRSFFLLHNYNPEEAFEILNKQNCNFTDKDVFYDFVFAI